MEDLLNTYLCMKSFIKDEEFLDYIRLKKFRKYNDFFLNMIIKAGSNKELVFYGLSHLSIDKAKLKKLAINYELYYRSGLEVCRNILLIHLLKIIRTIRV